MTKNRQINAVVSAESIFMKNRGKSANWRLLRYDSTTIQYVSMYLWGSEIHFHTRMYFTDIIISIETEFSFKYIYGFVNYEYARPFLKINFIPNRNFVLLQFLIVWGDFRLTFSACSSLTIRQLILAAILRVCQPSRFL